LGSIRAAAATTTTTITTQACQSQASWGRLGTQITDLNNLKIRQHIAGKFNNKNLSNGYTEIDTVQVA
jgi:hypothetical protein